MSFEYNYKFTKDLNSFYSFYETVGLCYDSIVLYGAGTVSKIITAQFPSKIRCILDLDDKIQNLNEIEVFHPKKIKEIDYYDIILITVLGREEKIINYLVEELDVSKSKILVFEINDYLFLSDSIKLLRANLHQKKLNCKFNLLPYKIDSTVKIMNLIFFMGVGDFLYVSPLLRKIKELNSDIKLIGYVSSNKDQQNNPLVYEMLMHDPNIDEVYYFNGKMGNRWEEYDFSDAINQISTGDDTIYPIVFNDTNSNSKHRVIEVFKSFSLEIDEDNIPKPLLYIKDFSKNKVKNILLNINSSKEIVLLHLESRSATYSYKNYESLIESIIKKGYFVIFISGEEKLMKFASSSFFHLNVNHYELYDTIAFINEIKQTKYMIAVNSVMFPISSALNIKTLGLFIFNDSTQTRQVCYDNMTILTIDKNSYEFLQKINKKCYLVNEGLIDISNGFCVNYSSSVILKYFIDFVKTT